MLSPEGDTLHLAVNRSAIVFSCLSVFLFHLPRNFPSFLPSCLRFNKHLSNTYCVPGPILGAWQVAMNKTEQKSLSSEAYISKE